MKVIMSYVRPLSWMALGLAWKLLKHMLALIFGFIIAAPILWVVFWLQDLSGRV